MRSIWGKGNRGSELSGPLLSGDSKHSTSGANIMPVTIERSGSGAVAIGELSVGNISETDRGGGLSVPGKALIRRESEKTPRRQKGKIHMLTFPGHQERCGKLMRISGVIECASHFETSTIENNNFRFMRQALIHWSACLFHKKKQHIHISIINKASQSSIANIDICIKEGLAVGRIQMLVREHNLQAAKP